MNQMTYAGILWGVITKCLEDNPSASLVSINDGDEFAYEYDDEQIEPVYSINIRIGRFRVNNVPVPGDIHSNLDDIDRTRLYLYEALFGYCIVLLAQGELCQASENTEALSVLFDCLRPHFGNVIYTLRLLGWNENSIEFSRDQDDRLHLLTDMVESYSASPCDQKLAMIQEIEPFVVSDLKSIWDNEQFYFRLVDDIGDTLLYCRENIRQLLLCDQSWYHEPDHMVFFRMRMDYYLRHNEPHFRSIIFRFHKEEIMIRLVLFQSVFDGDVTREIMMIYLWGIISP